MLQRYGFVKAVFSFFALLLIGVLFSQTAFALLLTDREVILNPKDRSGVVTIKNTTNDTATFRLSLTDMIMGADGKVVFVKDDTMLEGSPYRSARDYVRFSPRRVVLTPGQIQQVRVMPRRKGTMEAGEYRVYLTLTQEPPSETVEQQLGLQGKSSSEAQANLKALVTWRFPIIMRHGDVSLDVGLANVRSQALGRQLYRFTFDVQRSGNMSALGQINFVCQGSEVLLDSMPMRVYPEVSQRSYYKDVKIEAADCRAVRLDYMTSTDNPVRKNEVLATAAVGL